MIQLNKEKMTKEMLKTRNEKKNQMAKVENGKNKVFFC